MCVSSLYVCGFNVCVSLSVYIICICELSLQHACEYRMSLCRDANCTTAMLPETVASFRTALQAADRRLMDLVQFETLLPYSEGPPPDLRVMRRDLLWLTLLVPAVTSRKRAADF